MVEHSSRDVSIRKLSTFFNFYGRGGFTTDEKWYTASSFPFVLDFNVIYFLAINFEKNL